MPGSSLTLTCSEILLACVNKQTHESPNPDCTVVSDEYVHHGIPFHKGLFMMGLKVAVREGLS